MDQLSLEVMGHPPCESTAWMKKVTNMGSALLTGQAALKIKQHSFHSFKDGSLVKDRVYLSRIDLVTLVRRMTTYDPGYDPNDSIRFRC